MKVPNEIITQWKVEYEHGDIEAIRKQAGLNRKTIKDALRTGNMEKETFDKISKFYSDRRKEKQKMIAQALK